MTFLLNFFKKLFKTHKSKKPRTLKETIEFINNSYHFTQFDENLVSEIYTLLLPYGDVGVIKEEEHKYIISIISNTTVSSVESFLLTSDGLKSS